MRITHYILCALAASAIAASAADETAERMQRSATVLDAMTKSGHGIPAETLANADCVAVVPGFKKGAAVVGAGFGKGFITCRTEGGWSAPGAITLESASLGVQFGGEKIDIVIVSLDKERRSKLLSERFTIGADASAAWVSGKSAHQDPNARILFYAHTKGTFAGFGLDGATLKTDVAGNKSLYGKSVTNGAIVEGGTEAPASAQPLIAELSRESGR